MALGLKVEILSVYDLKYLWQIKEDERYYGRDEDDESDCEDPEIMRIGEAAPVKSSTYSSEDMCWKDRMELFFSETRRLEPGTVWVRKPDNFALQVRDESSTLIRHYVL